MSLDITYEGIRVRNNEKLVDETTEAFKFLMMITSNIKKSQKFCKTKSSYKLKHDVEKILKEYTAGEIGYISNGELILAMLKNGFLIRRISLDSKNVYFNISSDFLDVLKNKVKKATS